MRACTRIRSTCTMPSPNEPGQKDRVHCARHWCRATRRTEGLNEMSNDRRSDMPSRVKSDLLCAGPEECEQQSPLVRRPARCHHGETRLIKRDRRSTKGHPRREHVTRAGLPRGAPSGMPESRLAFGGLGRRAARLAPHASVAHQGEDVAATWADRATTTPLEVLPRVRPDQPESAQIWATPSVSAARADTSHDRLFEGAWGGGEGCCGRATSDWPKHSIGCVNTSRL